MNSLYGSYEIDGKSVDYEGSPGALYIFSLYWVFTTLTTVGYGDYAGDTSSEYGVTLMFEFFGFCYNAVLISVMSSFFANEASFDDLLDSRIN